MDSICSFVLSFENHCGQGGGSFFFQYDMDDGGRRGGGGWGRGSLVVNGMNG